MKKFGRKLLATLVASTMVLSMAACGSSDDKKSDSGSGDTEATTAADTSGGGGDLIKVGINIVQQTIRISRLCSVRQMDMMHHLLTA